MIISNNFFLSNNKPFTKIRQNRHGRHHSNRKAKLHQFQIKICINNVIGETTDKHQNLIFSY